MGLCRLCDKSCSENGRLENRFFLEKVLDIICMWIDVDDGSVGSNACDTCYERVEEFYTFKHNCRLIQIKFKSGKEELRSRTTENLDKLKTPKLQESDKPVKKKSSSAPKTSKPKTPPKPPRKAPLRNPFPFKPGHVVVKPAIRKFREAAHLSPEEYRLYALRHYSYKRKTIMCELCGKQIDNNRMEGHRNRHRGVQPFQCETCGEKFHCELNLKAHCRRLHVQGQQTVCPVCQKVYPSKPALRTHMYGVHGERRYQCAKCPFKFNCPSSLARHLKMHNQTRDFKCTLCPKAFYDKAVWQIHMRTHTGDRPYKCDVCGADFVHRNMYVRHMGKNHPGHPLMVLNGRQMAKETIN